MVVSESLSRDIFRIIVWYPIRYLVYLLPIRCGFFLLRLMGDCHYFLSRGKKRILAENLRSIFPDLSTAEEKKILKEYFENHFINQLQIFLFPKFNINNIDKFHTFVGLEKIDAALQKGKGCILIHPHFGPAQLPLHLLGIKGYKVVQLGFLTSEGLSYIGKKIAFDLRVKLESKIKARIIQADGFLRPIFECLKENNVLLMTGDGAGGGKFIGKYKAVTFLRGKYLFPIGAASIAAKTGAALLPAFITLEDGKYKTIIESPIYLENTEESINMAATHFVNTFEKYLRKQPALWHFWDELKIRKACENT